MRNYTNFIVPLMWKRETLSSILFSRSGFSVLIFLLSLIFSHASYAQNAFCGTEATPEQIAYMSSTREARQRFQITDVMSREVARIPVQAHIVTLSDGSGGVSVEMVEQQLAGTNAYFQAANMEFFLCDAPNYINSDTYYDLDVTEEAAMTNGSIRENIINMYFVSSIIADGRPLCGYAYFPGNQDVVVMANDCVNPEVLAHELGHYFSLYHTHGKSNCGATDELADGSNCATAGDDVCDTPADPNLGGPDCSNQLLDENCNYTGIATDANGQAYTPLTNNIMSYGRQSCWTTFTPQQNARLRYSLENDRAYLTCGSTSTVCEQAITAIDCGETVNASTVGKSSTLNAYCNETEGYTGPENVYQLNWAGGIVEISLSDLQADLDILLLNTCDPTACAASSTSTGTDNELISMDLDAGTYYIMVEGWEGASSAYQLSVNSPDGCSQVQLPDYQPTVMTGPSSAMVGDNIEMQVTLVNNGSADGLGNGGKDKYYISTLPNLTPANLEANATLLQAYDTDNIGAGETKQYPGGITIPENISSGSYFIYFFLDADNTIAESNEENNLIAHPITISRDLDPYCQAEGHPGTGSDYITSVSLNTLSNTSEKTQYSDFTSQSTTLEIGQAYTLEIGLGFSFPLDAAYGWIDFNQNNVFDTSELINMSGFNAEHKSQGSFTVPADALLGTTRLRVRSIYADPQVADPCGTYAGEVEDYSVMIESTKPDYQPTDFVARGGVTTLQAGGSLVIDLKINNNGLVDGFGNGGKDKYYLNATPDLSGSPVFLRDFETADISANNGFDVNSGSLEIPANTTPGTYYIVFFHDADNTIAESNEDNNIVYLQITVSEQGSGLSINFTADNTNPCVGDSVQFTSNIENNTASINTLHDFSGNGNHGTMRNFEGNPYTNHDGFGAALTFDNVNDYVECGNILPISYTKEVWINPTDVTGNLISGDGVNGDAFWIANNTVISGQKGSFANVGDPNPIASGWQHYAVTYDAPSQTMTLYRNGQVVSTASDVAPAQAPNGVVYLSTWGLNSNYFGGQMDEVRIWDGARTADQIQANYNKELTGNEAGLVAYYKFSPQNADLSYSWVFAGGTPSTSSEANPSVTYTNPGTYRVSLTITGSGQTDSEVKEGYIIVEDCSFTIDFTADTTEPCAGQDVTFTSYVAEGDAIQVHDFSGNGNHGTFKYFGETPFDNVYIDNAGYGRALNFDGSNDYIELPENLTAGLTQFTYEARFLYGGTNAWQRLMNFGDDPAKTMFFVPNSNNGKTRFWIGDGNTSGWVETTDALVAGQWYHLAVTIDGNATENDVKIYINGELKGQGTILIKPSDLGNLSSNWIGKSQFSWDPYLVGQLDEVRIWGTARSQTELQASMNSELTGGESGLLVYYNFNQSTSNYTYNWSFPGGTPSSSTDANPTVSYSTPGTYDVMLTVNNGTRSETATKVAYITAKACEPDWPVTQTGDNHTVIVTSDVEVILDGLSVAEGDYLGAFYDDNGVLKCAGKIKWTGTNVAATIYGDDPTTTVAKDGFGVGETFQWKLWKVATNEEIEVVASYEEPGDIITHKGQFAVNGLSQIKRLTQGTLSQTQTVALQPGWNLVSSYIQPTSPDMTDVFSAISSQLSIVKDETGTSYIPSSSINDIGNWRVVEGYQVRVLGNTQVDLEITGLKVDPVFTPIDLNTGWNLIPYLRETEQDIATALNPVTSEVHIVKNIDGQIYMPSLGINNIGNMKPGQAYWVKMRSDVSLNYTARMATPPANMHAAQILPVKYRIERRGIHNATLILDTKDLVEYGDEIGVFDTEGRLVGAATYEGRVLAFSIWGDDLTTDEVDGLEEGAEFEIRAWNHMAETEKVFVFNANVDLYTTNAVIEAELLRTTNTTSLVEANSLKLYPNPTRNQATLSLNLKSHATVEVSLYDLAGKQVLRIAKANKTLGSHEWKLNTTSLPSGLYHCKVLVDGIIHNIPFSVVK